MTSRRFILHESSQRSLCRLAFVVFGAAPLVFCLYLCIAAMIPGYHRRQAAMWEQELESKFGLKFRVTEVYTLAPCKYRLEGVQVFQARSSKLVGRCESIEIQLDHRQVWQVVMRKPELRLDQIALAGKELHERYLSQHSMPTALIQSDRLTVSDDEDTIELAELNINLSTSAELAGMSAGFRIVPAIGSLTTEPPSHLVVVRRHPSATTYDVGLRVHRLSCSVLSKIFDLKSTSAGGVRHSLQGCLFSGIMGIHTEGNKSNYYIRDASVQQIDMGQLVLGSESMISGIAKIDELNAIFDASQIHSVQGKLAVESGRIDAQFLNSVAYHLQMSVVPQTSVRNIAFDRLSLEFKIWPQFVSLAGMGSKPGIVIEDAKGPLAWKPMSTPQPIMSLVHALAYRTDSPTLPSRITPLVRTALVWLPLEEQQRREAELVIRR